MKIFGTRQNHKTAKFSCKLHNLQYSWKRTCAQIFLQLFSKIRKIENNTNVTINWNTSILIVERYSGMCICRCKDKQSTYEIQTDIRQKNVRHEQFYGNIFCFPAKLNLITLSLIKILHLHSLNAPSEFLHKLLFPFK